MPPEAAAQDIPPPQIIEVDSDKVGCDGGEGPLGHPLVYLTLDAGGKVDCPYCGRRYIRRAGKGGAGH